MPHGCYTRPWTWESGGGAVGATCPPPNTKLCGRRPLIFCEECQYKNDYFIFVYELGPSQKTVGQIRIFFFLLSVGTLNPGRRLPTPQLQSSSRTPVLFIEHGLQDGYLSLNPHVKGTNPAMKKSSNIPEIYAKMFGRFH